MIDINDQIPASNGITLKEFWKIKMIETLSTIYGSDNLNFDKVEQYLDSIISKSHEPIAQMRNIYEERIWEVPLDNIPKLIDENKLIIGANGTFTYRHEIKISEMSELLRKWLANRDKLKKLALQYEDAGDISSARKYDNHQTSTKENINSAYGVSVMPGYILHSPDSASMITSQARECISEELWTLEKFLGNNMCFKDINELYSYVNEVTRIKLDENLIFQYNIKVPTFEMLTKRLKELSLHVPKIEYEDVDNSKSMFLMLKNISKDPIKSINFYYKYNLYEFLIHNPDVMHIINWMNEQDQEFYSPDTKKMASCGAAIYVEPIKELVKLFTHFVIAPIPTYDRVEKYLKRGRVIIPVSDTDSIMPTLKGWVDFVSSYGSVKFDTFYDEKATFRNINIMAMICTDVCNYMAQNLARNCYIPKDQRSKLQMKNEFLFKSLLLYPNIKKNYSAWVRLREGVIVNKIANTGLTLTGSNINPFVAKVLKGIISEEIHYVKDISITRIMKRVYDLQSAIRNELVNNRNSSFGIFTAYKTSNRVDNMSSSSIRAVEIWNWLYPDNRIDTYNKVYVLNTILERENQLNLIQDIHMRELIREKIFKNPSDPNVSKYGLRTIAIPDNMLVYPKWLADIVDVNRLVERHVNSITSLLPSIGVYLVRMNSTRKHLSSLINL